MCFVAMDTLVMKSNFIRCTVIHHGWTVIATIFKFICVSWFSFWYWSHHFDHLTSGGHHQLLLLILTSTPWLLVIGIFQSLLLVGGLWSLLFNHAVNCFLYGLMWLVFISITLSLLVLLGQISLISKTYFKGPSQGLFWQLPWPKK